MNVHTYILKLVEIKKRVRIGREKEIVREVGGEDGEDVRGGGGGGGGSF